jgi:hypothetical protein
MPDLDNACGPACLRRPTTALLLVIGFAILGMGGLFVGAFVGAPPWVLMMFGGLIPFSMGLGLFLYVMAEVCA